MNKQKFLNYALIVVLTILVMQIFAKPQQSEDTGPRDDLEISAKAEFTTGEAVALKLTNNTEETFTFESDCPAEPLDVLKYRNGEWEAVSAETENCSTDSLIIESGATGLVEYKNWQKELFRDSGRYRIEIPLTIADAKKTFFHELEVTEPGVFRSIGRTLFYRPIYNGMIFLTSITPSKSFGLGIIMLTILLRLILFVPFQKSLKSQRKMQKIQPELDAIKKKYAENKQMVATETMALMKKNKVSPFGSCLPVLIQMPFLLALFWATRDGLGENNFVYLYGFLQNFDFNAVSTSLLGLDLIKSGAQFYFALPITLAVLQFAQMKMALSRTKKKDSQDGANPMADAMHSMGKMMPYFLPIMIAVFSSSMPAAVGLYWGASTLFSLGQQIVVNRQVK